MKIKYKYYLWISILYIVIICWLLFLQVGITVRSSYFTSKEIHIIPFKNTFNSIRLAIYNNFGPPHKNHYRYIIFRNIMGNIILFIPWGVLFPNLISKLSTFRYTVLSAIIFSLGVEAIQYFMIIGVADIDDVFLNAIGASVGFYTFQLLKRKY